MSVFLVCSTLSRPLAKALICCSMEELSFKIVKVYDARDEVIARVSNFEVCKAAFEKALFVWPTEHLEMRQGTRIISKSKEAGDKS